MEDDFLAGEPELSALLDGFENGTWPIAKWRHMHHLAVAACHIAEGNAPMDRLRTHIRSYNERQGGRNTEDSGYHETITRFRVEVVSRYLASLPAGLPRLEIARRVVAEFASRRDMFRDYYDFDVVKSREARAKWIPPALPLSNQGSI